MAIFVLIVIASAHDYRCMRFIKVTKKQYDILFMLFFLKTNLYLFINNH